MSSTELTERPGGETATTGTPQLSLQHVSRAFKGLPAVTDVSFDVEPGEVFALLGPSGCGKSTTLRMIAGLERVDDGTITMAGRLLATGGGRQLAPERRDVAMVFQSSAVWPHMSVRKNIEFPLKMRHVKRAERAEMVDRVLDVTGLTDYADRSATLLSGGQQQRVALARALVYAPGLLLLDEPLSNLDARLRIQMRREIRRLNEELGITMLFVTHDQDEALSLADRIAVMNHGVIEQIGAPIEMYEKPATPFVRDFLGRMLQLDGVVAAAGASPEITLDLGGTLTGTKTKAPLRVGERVGVFFRPDDVEVAASGGHGAGVNEVPARVIGRQYLGETFEYQLRVGEATVLVESPRRARFEVGDDVLLLLDTAQATVWPQ
jgi:ABC-type Fe3+/spermidine/putrescine transport system ATPase subunit